MENKYGIYLISKVAYAEGMKERVTLKKIAKDLGLSTQTVSVALRGARGVGDATRERIRARAEELGYSPDPGLRALAEYRTRGRKVANRWNQVALLHNWPTEKWLIEDSFYGLWFRELAAAAEQRGINIIPFWLGAQGEKTTAVFRTLRNRGITGVFLAPPALSPYPPAIRMPHQEFQIVTFGPEHLYPDLHTVQFDFYENLRLAWRVLWDRGRRRIGLVYSKHQGWRTGHAWQAAFHVEKLLTGCPPGERMPLELTGSLNSQRARYRQWLREGRCDAVISSVRGLEGIAPRGMPPPEIALFNVMHPEEQGIDLHLPQMAQTAVELLLLEMQRSLVSERSLPFRVHIPGRWVAAKNSEDQTPSTMNENAPAADPWRRERRG